MAGGHGEAGAGPGQVHNRRDHGNGTGQKVCERVGGGNGRGVYFRVNENKWRSRHAVSATAFSDTSFRCVDLLVYQQNTHGSLIDHLVGQLNANCLVCQPSIEHFD
jgi:hypothetical protein